MKVQVVKYWNNTSIKYTNTLCRRHANLNITAGVTKL